MPTNTLTLTEARARLAVAQWYLNEPTPTAALTTEGRRGVLRREARVLAQLRGTTHITPIWHEVAEHFDLPRGRVVFGTVTVSQWAVVFHFLRVEIERLVSRQWDARQLDFEKRRNGLLLIQGGLKAHDT